MKHKITWSIYDYWDTRRGDQIAPERSDIEPSEIKSWLGNTFILQVNEDSTRFRLAGTRICSLYCRELKGADFSAFWTAEDCGMIRTALRSISNDGSTVLLSANVVNSEGDETALEIQLLPLKQGSAGYSRILGSVAILSEPYWVGIHPVIHQRITNLSLSAPQTKSNSTANVFNQRTPPRILEFPIEQSNQKTRQFAHLRIFDGGRS